MFRFTIRELVLLTAIAALVVGWWLDRRDQGDRIYRRDSQIRELASALQLDGFSVVIGDKAVVIKRIGTDWEQRAKKLGALCAEYDLNVEWEPTGFRITKRIGKESMWVPDVRY
jgi:hypothetical protein